MFGAGQARAILIWAILTAIVVLPIAVAATSPFLAWRDPVYIIAGFAGVVSMALLLLQPLLAGGYLPGLRAHRSRKVHVWVGTGLVAAVVVHVGGLWITSPPDVIDVFLFRSPTPFSVWGVVAMWAVFVAALLAALRRRIKLRPMLWRLFHMAFAMIVVVGGVIHALLIQGTMGTVSKAVLCALVLAAAVRVTVHFKPWTVLTRRKAGRKSRHAPMR